VDDGGGCIDPVAAGAGRWIVTANTSNIIDYGAYQDGTHSAETTAAINAALTATNAAYIPAGSYLVSAVVLSSGQTITGEGSTSILVSDLTELGPIISADTKTDITISGIVLNGGRSALGPSAASYGMKFDNCQRVKIEKCELHHLNADACRFIGGGNHRVKNCYTHDNVVSGISTANSEHVTIESHLSYKDGGDGSSGAFSSISINGKYNKLLNSTITDNISSGQGVTFGHDPVVASAAYSLCAGNTIKTITGYGIRVVNSDYVVITDNLIEDASLYGIFLFKYGVAPLLLNTTISNNTIKGGQRAIDNGATANNLIITGNHCISQTVYALNMGAVENSIISDNYIYGGANHAIKANVAAKDTVISRNIINGVAIGIDIANGIRMSILDNVVINTTTTGISHSSATYTIISGNTVNVAAGTTYAGTINATLRRSNNNGLTGVNDLLRVGDSLLRWNTPGVRLEYSLDNGGTWAVIP